MRMSNIIRARSVRSTNRCRSWSKMNAVHVALLCSIPLVTLFAPTVKEKTAALVSLTNALSAYEGDGILIADTGSSDYVWWWWPSMLTTQWTLRQRPVFGDAHHTISFYLAPKSIAHRFLYRFDSNYTSDYFFVDGDFRQVLQGQQHLAIRRNIYILPQQYTPGREANAKFVVDVKKALSLERNETLGYTLCQFQNRDVYTNFIDLEPGAIDGMYRCHCNLGDPLPCNGTEDCVSGVISPKYCSKDSFGPYFTAVQSSYNFFTTIVPTKSFVKYTANITMYFYDEAKLIKHAQYICTIRDRDTCSIIIPQLSWYYEPQLIIAYIHPKAGAYALTTTISVEASVGFLENAARSMLYLLIPGTVIKIILSYYPSF